MIKAIWLLIPIAWGAISVGLVVALLISGRAGNIIKGAKGSAVIFWPFMCISKKGRSSLKSIFNRGVE